MDPNVPSLHNFNRWLHNNQPSKATTSNYVKHVIFILLLLLFIPCIVVVFVKAQFIEHWSVLLPFIIANYLFVGWRYADDELVFEFFYRDPRNIRGIVGKIDNIMAMMPLYRLMYWLGWPFICTVNFIKKYSLMKLNIRCSDFLWFVITDDGKEIIGWLTPDGTMYSLNEQYNLKKMQDAWTARLLLNNITEWNQYWITIDQIEKYLS